MTLTAESIGASTVNAYETAQAYGITGTDAECVTALKAIQRHARNAYITGGPCNTESVNLLHLLTARHRVMGMGPHQEWIGPLIDLEAQDQTVSQVLSILRPLLQVNDTVVYCKDSDNAAQMLNALTDIVGLLTQKPEQITAEVALLSGGRIGAQFADLTVEQFAEQRSQVVLETEINDALAAVRAKLDHVDNAARIAARAHGATADSISAAAQLAWGST
jgi:hypothetical protein